MNKFAEAGFTPSKMEVQPTCLPYSKYFVFGRIEARFTTLGLVARAGLEGFRTVKSFVVLSVKVRSSGNSASRTVVISRLTMTAIRILPEMDRRLGNSMLVPPLICNS
jgi:hypothetical protein